MKPIPLRTQLGLVAARLCCSACDCGVPRLCAPPAVRQSPRRRCGGERDVRSRRLDAGDHDWLHVTCPDFYSGAGDPQVRTPLRRVFQDPAWPESDFTDLPGSAQYPGREPGDDVTGLDLLGSSALLADRDCGTGGQPVAGTV